MRLLLGTLFLATLFLAASLWQRHWTSAARSEREARISRIEPREAPETAVRQDLGEGWSRVVLGRPGGGEAYRVSARTQPAQAHSDPVEPRVGSTAPTPVASSTASSAQASAGTAMAKTERVIVRPGQSLSRICREHYGTARVDVVEAVAGHNRLASPDLLRAGEELDLPPLEELLPRR